MSYTHASAAACSLKITRLALQTGLTQLSCAFHAPSHTLPHAPCVLLLLPVRAPQLLELRRVLRHVRHGCGYEGGQGGGCEQRLGGGAQAGGQHRLAAEGRVGEVGVGAAVGCRGEGVESGLGLGKGLRYEERKGWVASLWL